MNVIIYYKIENQEETVLKKAYDWFASIDMKKVNPEESYGFVEKETGFISDEPVGEHFLKQAVIDFKSLRSVLGVDFELQGVIDTSETAGECKNFSIQSNGDSLQVKASDWYVETAMDSYEDYEEFCDCFFECSEKAFNALRDNEFIYLLEEKTGDRLSAEVPLYDISLS